jgi:4-amino-4-deoxy-L-arabinose transferase-like glycosyltransferase
MANGLSNQTWLDPKGNTVYKPVVMPSGRDTTPGFTAAVVLIVSLLNLVYLGVACPLDLSPDEAHYWDWSRQLDWCYYSKGPLVAWLIRWSCEVFGQTAFAVRCPAVVCGGLLLLGLGRIAAWSSRSERFALLVVLLAITLPPFSAASILMTIDPPFLACWAWATVAIQRQRWKLAGLCVAVGTLAKTTMLLFPACLGLLLLVQPTWRSGKFVPFLLLGSVGLLPVVVWNLTHDFVGLRHLLGHADNGGKPADWFSPLAFVGGQSGLLLAFWFIVWLCSIWKYRPGPEQNRDDALLWWLSCPVFVLFLLASYRTTGQPNWPAAGYITGFVLAVSVVRNAGSTVRILLIGTVVLGLSLSVALRWPNLIRPIFAMLVPAPTVLAPTPVRRLDPTARLVGWRTLASALDDLRHEQNAKLSEEVLLAGMAWTIPGELAFYCEGHPVAYSFGAAVGDRASQYDVWRPNPVADAQAFAGRTFLYVGDQPPAGLFDRVEVGQRVTHSEGGVPLATWTIWICTGYRGFAHPRPERY